MKTKFFNTKLDVYTGNEVLSVCRKYLFSESIHTMFFLNAHCLNMAQKNPAYLNAVNNADLVLNDGIGIKIASTIRGVRLRENLNGTDLIPRILDLAEENNIKVYLFGGKENVSARAAERLSERNPSLVVSGFRSGYFNKGEESDIIREINASGAQLLILGMGVPKQELWAEENKAKLKNVKLIVAGGAILDFISGEISRAPYWMRRINMEWIYRLYLEPGRMWKRYMVGNILFFYHILNYQLINNGRVHNPEKPQRYL